VKITAVRSRSEHLGLTRPYTIAFRTVDAVANAVVEVDTDAGLGGTGAASPEPHVTGETMEACRAALAGDRLDWLLGQDVRELGRLVREAGGRMRGTPAALAAVDIALHDLWAQHLGLPLADALGRVHDALPTSITIGIKGVEETVQEAREYLERGFRVLKVKLGHSLDQDLERLRRLRADLPSRPAIRVDANQGYSPEETRRFAEASAALDVEFMEQPVPVADTDALRDLPEAVRDRIAADESLLDERDALALVAPPRACGIFNIKLMKCGGVRAGMRIAAIAETAGTELMWGCMDESAASIAAALHAAFASTATRYIDLDGSLDLARDVVEGGFVLEDGIMRTLPAPGLGLRRLA